MGETGRNVERRLIASLLINIILINVWNTSVQDAIFHLRTMHLDRFYVGIFNPGWRPLTRPNPGLPTGRSSGA